MGVYLHYQAMPPESRLLERLRSERLLCVMYTRLIHHPAGPFDLDRLPVDEHEDRLHDIARCEPAFVSEAEVEHWYADLRGELEWAAAGHPGLRQRAAYIKLIETDHDLERILTEAGVPNPGETARQVVWGSEPLGPTAIAPGNPHLCWSPPAVVTAGAAVLSRIDAPRGSYLSQNLGELRHVYSSAAALGEGIVIA